MKKKLIVTGCSWVDPHILSEDPRVSNEIVQGYKKWPNILAEMLDMTIINYGKAASGNEYIFSSIVDNITKMNEEEKNNIGLVVIAWTEAKRTDFEYKKNDNDHYIKGVFEKIANRYEKNYVWDSVLYTDPLRGDMFYRVRQSIRYIYTLQTFLKYHNIPYKMVQSIPMTRMSALHTDFNPGSTFGSSQRSLMSTIDVEKEIKKILTLEDLQYFPMYEQIDKSNFIGYPILNYSLFQKLDPKKDFISDLTKTDPKYRNDDHPNQSGHDKIANTIFSYVRKKDYDR